MTRLSIMNVARSSALLLALAACKSTGMGAETRADIAVQMKKAEAPIQTCYGAALKQNRRIKGRFSVRL
ncbi:MAG TPA: hypothetical protein VN253_10690, partial [Kofleriaceae bacterium]|nr:hypothetical protein [Kofleriaceae bacterium]